MKFNLVNKILKKSYHRAATLTEVMIVLGIVSVAMIGSLSILTASLSKSRANEVEDATNTLLLQILELAKSPAPVKISHNITSTPFNHILTRSSTQNRLVRSTVSFNFNDCAPNSPYNVTALLPAQVQNYQVCVSVVIDNRNAAGAYRMRIYSVYNIGNEVIRTNLVGYRYGDFIVEN